MFRGGGERGCSIVYTHDAFILNCGSQFPMFPLGSYASEDVPSRCNVLLSTQHQLLAVLCLHLGYLLAFRFDSSFFGSIVGDLIERKHTREYPIYQIWTTVPSCNVWTFRDLEI